MYSSTYERGEPPTVVLYHCPGSTPCHFVRVVANLLGVRLKFVWIRVPEGEQMKPDFLKINPQHCVPTITDGDFNLWESRAIATYFCDQYGKGDLTFYPKDPKKRGLIMKWMVYDAEKVFPAVLRYVEPHWFGNNPTQEHQQQMEAVFKELNLLLAGKRFMTGDSFTIADITTRCSIAQLMFTPYVLQGGRNLMEWIERVDDQVKGLKEIHDEFRAFIKDFYSPKKSK